MSKSNNPTAPIARIDLQLYADRVAVNVQLDIDRTPDDGDIVGETIDDVAWMLRGAADALSFRHRHRAEIEGGEKKSKMQAVIEALPPSALSALKH
jgi:hypothetical protein